ncbi:hypothetical protein T492DRAFT_842874 [Pavlovales sp. CCMP2436]|nr:hypothetical protein T492DRAFT_842874 [Pavlovales sp. CCMP2436]
MQQFPGSDRFNFEHHAYNEERLGALEEAHELKYQEMREHAPEYNMNHWDILEAEAEFRLADVGGDFKLSHEEAVTIFNKMGLDTRKGDNAKMLDEYMRQVDNEGDQILEFDEFIQIIQMLKQAAIDAERLSASLKPQVGRNKPRANKLKIRRHTLVRDHKRKPLRKDASRLLRFCFNII